MTAVQELPVIPVHSVDFPYEGPPCTRQQLLNALFALANNNPHFKRGTADEVGFKVEEVERVEDARLSEGIASIEYSFRAVRSRIESRRPRVDFSFGLNARLERVILPPFMTDPLAEMVVAAAMEEEGYHDTLSDEIRDAVSSSMWGQYDHVIDHKFFISNRKGYELQSIEVHSYRDEDDIPVNEIMDEMVHPDGVVYTASGADSDSNSVGLTQHVTEQFSERLARERIKNIKGDDEESTKLREFWESYVLLEEASTNPEEEEKRKIRVAYAVLQRIQRAQLIQAGVKVPRLSRKKDLV